MARDEYLPPNHRAYVVPSYLPPVSAVPAPPARPRRSLRAVRGPAPLVARVALRQALLEYRLRRVATLILVCAAGALIPTLIVADARSLQRHLRTGTVVEVVVERTKPARGKGGCREIVFTLEGRRREMCADKPDPGDRVAIVVDARRKRLEPADAHVMTPTEIAAASAVLTAGIAAVTGWFLTGRGVAPRAACRAARRRRPDVIAVVVEDMRPVRSPRGRLHDRWRRGEARRCYELRLRADDGRAVTWTGFLTAPEHHPDRTRIGDTVLLIGDLRDHGWTWLYRTGLRTLHVPATRLAA